MTKPKRYASGRPYLQVPGPTNIPDRVLRAMDRPIIDHRSPEFAELMSHILPDLRATFGTQTGDVVIYPASGSGAWEASLVNVLSPGDRVLAFNYGHFCQSFTQTARDLGFDVDEVSHEWGRGFPHETLAEMLRQDSANRPYRAVLAVHNETSTGVTSDIGAVRRAMDAANHDALLIVDAVSSLASIRFEFDAWRLDVAVAASQKGLMLPPGLGILCVGPRAIRASEHAKSPRSYWDWRRVIEANKSGHFPYTPPTLLLFGLREALRMLIDEEGLEHVFARHARVAEAVRRAVQAWDLSTLCRDVDALSNTLTVVQVPVDQDAEQVVARARENYGLALGIGLGSTRRQVFRIGHLGSLNELDTLAVISGVEMALVELGMISTVGDGLAAGAAAFLPRQALTSSGAHVGGRQSASRE